MTIIPVVSVLLLCILAAPVSSQRILLNASGQLVCNAALPFKAEISLLEYNRVLADGLLGIVRLESDTNIIPFNFSTPADLNGFSDDLKLYLQISHNCNSMDQQKEKLRFDTDIIEVKENPKIQDVNWRSIDITNRGERVNGLIEKNVIKKNNAFPF